jgi:ribosome-associated toxin RatA of RatAB toxin-antitoxin module
LTAHVTADDTAPDVIITVERGTYSVAARFDVPETPGAALAVLSDYEQIPRFMPGVRKSVIVERTPAHLVVEQEAVTQYLMFSKTVHLVLVVTEAGNTIQFTDRAHDSFRFYEGSWRVTPRMGDTGGATIAYAVTARPAFDVPGFVLKRLLTRDSDEMISGLRREIAARVAGTLPDVSRETSAAERRTRPGRHWPGCARAVARASSSQRLLT